MARQLDGTSQRFDLSVNGIWRRTNNNYFIGGWCQFLNASAVQYIMDFGRLDAGPSGGTARNRLLYDPANSRLLASSSMPDGSSYRENSVTGFVPDNMQWHYIGFIAQPNNDIVGYLNKQKGTVSAGAQPTPASDNVCHHLRFGARAYNTPSSFANVRLADWIWCSDSVPTDAQLAALADGKQPSEVDGLVYHHHWAFDQEGDEPSLVSSGALSAVNSPTVVAGPSFGSAAPLPIIMI